MDYIKEIQRLKTRISYIAVIAMQLGSHNDDERKDASSYLNLAIHEYQNAITVYQWLSQNDHNGNIAKAFEYKQNGDQEIQKANKILHDYPEYMVHISTSSIDLKQEYKNLQARTLRAYSTESIESLSDALKTQYAECLSSSWKNIVYISKADKVPEQSPTSLTNIYHAYWPKSTSYSIVSLLQDHKIKVKSLPNPDNEKQVILSISTSAKQGTVFEILKTAKVFGAKDVDLVCIKRAD